MHGQVCLDQNDDCVTKFDEAEMQRSDALNV